MKKLVLMAAAIVAVSFASCGNKTANNNAEATDTVAVEAPAEATEPAVEAAAVDTPAVAADAAAEATTDEAAAK